MKFGRILSVLAILVMIACVVQPVLADTEFDNGSAASAYYNRGSMAASSGQFDAAVELFNLALTSNTSLVAKSDTLQYIYNDKSAALTDLGRYEDAVTTADQGLALFKKAPGLWNNKGYALYKLGKYDDAVSAYKMAISIAEASNTSYPKGYINMGIALNAAGKPYDAITAFNKALELDPGNSAATAGLTEAQSAAMKTNIVLAVIVIIALGLVIWYVKFRKPADSKATSGKKDRKSKKE
ncbi:tetratricopeptide repeat protein [uncultured Methanoregula sp.]|uniref:tetratricopeptide repeat protein n=1 Tax=uncultured Methanoregula sp. TaxID=1005933 RepID=UPI002AAB4555|nr:tetratricopeptide repeat protein [uncultured Methanoregula sp.]